MSTIQSSLVVKLVDAVSGTARKVSASLGGIGQAARRLNSVNVAGFSDRLRRPPTSAST
jgi:hypothetical protein